MSLMLADYYLTILGYYLSNKKYREFFAVEHYELNPELQKPIYQRKLFNPRHLLLVFLTGFLLYLINFITTYCYYQMVVGAFSVLFTVMLGRHMFNILTFLYVIKNSDLLSGQVTLSYRFSLKISQYLVLPSLLPMLLVCVIFPHPFVFGGILGIAILYFIHIIWLHKAKK